MDLHGCLFSSVPLAEHFPWPQELQFLKLIFEQFPFFSARKQVWPKWPSGGSAGGSAEPGWTLWYHLCHRDICKGLQQRGGSFCKDGDGADDEARRPHVQWAKHRQHQTGQQGCSRRVGLWLLMQLIRAPAFLLELGGHLPFSFLLHMNTCPPSMLQNRAAASSSCKPSAVVG